VAAPSWRVAGVDGCRGGWLVAGAAIGAGGALTLEPLLVCSRFEDVLASGFAVVAVDIPIGLPDGPLPRGRVCDREARRLLGFPRCTSVFSAPSRPAVAAGSFAEAQARNGGMTLETFNVCAKVADVDAALDPAVQERVIEVHPELCFFELNEGRSVVEPKRKAAGRVARLTLLAGALAGALPGGLPGFRPRAADALASRPRRAAADDVLDALAALWTAHRYAEGRAVRVPASPPLDGRGLRMEIWR